MTPLRMMAPITALLLVGCALPKLPGLPNLTDIKEATGLVSTGDSLKEAVKLSASAADGWSTAAALVTVRGSRIDAGGRDQGFHDGEWLVTYQATTTQKGFAVHVSAGKVTESSETTYDANATTLDRGLTGLLDSTDLMGKAGVSGHSYTVILRGTPSGPRYDVLGEGDGTSGTLDAASGAKVTTP